MHHALGNLKSSHHDATTRAQTQHLGKSNNGNGARRVGRLQHLGGKPKKKGARAFGSQNANHGGDAHAVPAAASQREAATEREGALVRSIVEVHNVSSARHNDVKGVVKCSGQDATKHTRPAKRENQRSAQANMRQISNQNFNAMGLSLLMPADWTIEEKNGDVPK